MMEGKANMQFLDALNKVIARYESLTPLFEAMSVMMDYDTYWKDLMKNPRIKIRSSSFSLRSKRPC